MLRMTHTRGPWTNAIHEIAHAPIRIGSAPGNDIVLAGGERLGVMPAHAEIRWSGGEHVLVDLGTKHGTFVGQARVSEKALQNGDVVHFGDSQGPSMRIEILGPPVSIPASAMDAEGRVDLATAQRLVEAAVVAATRRPDKRSLIVQTNVASAVKRSSRLNALLAAGVIVTLVALAAAVILVMRSKRAASVLVAEAGLGDGPAIAAPSGTVPTKVLSGRDIYEQNRGALYVLAYVEGRRIGGCCSAFAIDARTLVTNAHCVHTCKSRGGKPVVVQNDSQGKTKLDVIAQRPHPGYLVESKSANSPDVALLRISGTMTKTVTLASDAELRALGPGDDVYVLGFPGRVMDPVSPSATFLNGHIGRVMGFDEQATSPDKAALVLHDAVTRGGNSGSPVFNQYGHVIGVHAAHVDDEEELSIGGTKTKVVQSSPFRIAMRIDLIRGVPAP